MPVPFPPLRRLARAGAVTLALGAAGCESLWGGFSKPGDVPDLAVAEDLRPAPDLAPARLDEIVDGRVTRNLDVLFLIDNSPSMSPKQQALAQNIPRFIQKIDALGANYHIGIATSDVGTFVAPGQPWSISLGACNSFEGDDGTLQRVACNTRTGVTSDASTACSTLCPDSKFVPAGGQGYIAKAGGVTNVPVEMAGGVDVGPQKAFQCLALVGDAGCGIEGSLEGAKRALDGHNPMNNGFLRPDSVLALVMITDEDDCSVSLARRSENDPITTDCQAPDKNAPAACFNPDYRCIARDLICDQPLNQTGPKTNCVERDNSYLEKVDSYVRFFTALRSPSRLLVSGIWTPASGPFITTQRAGFTKTDGLNRGEGADAGCVSATNPKLFGRPQVRLSKFAKQIPGSLEINVCEADRYPQALDSIAAGIQQRLLIQCLSRAPRLAGSEPACTVGEVDSPMETPKAPLPACSKGCCSAWATASAPTVGDATIKAACQAEAAESCYCAVPSTQPGICQGGAVAGVWRRGGLPPERLVRFQCEYNP